MYIDQRSEEAITLIGPSVNIITIQVHHRIVVNLIQRNESPKIGSNSEYSKAAQVPSIKSIDMFEKRIIKICNKMYVTNLDGKNKNNSATRCRIYSAISKSCF
jgi:hypothetical protein